MDNKFQLTKGAELYKRYVVTGVLGQGGFGITYGAMDTVLNKKVCIKELFVAGNSVRSNEGIVHTQTNATLSLNDFKDRFLAEAQQLAKYQHPGIVPVIDIFEENGTVYMVMEFVDGQTLKQVIEKEGPLPIDRAVPIIKQLLDAVDEVHNNNMLHRDIKPDNIIIGKNDRVVLIDFGSAREFTEGKVSTQTSMLTPGFAPMEQYSTRAERGVYTDIYAIGATFYYMLTSTKPLSAVDRIEEEMPSPHTINPAISEQLSTAIMMAMELKAENRFQNIEDFRMALQLMEQSSIGNNKIKSPRSQSPQKKTDSKKIANPISQKKKTNKSIPIVLGISVVVVVLYLLLSGILSDTTRSASPSTVAEKFLLAVNDLDFEGAKQYATAESASMLDMLSGLMVLSEEDVEPSLDYEVIVTAEQVNGDDAIVYFTSIDEDGIEEEESIDLTMVDDEWKVKFDKSSLGDLGDEDEVDWSEDEWVDEDYTNSGNTVSIYNISELSLCYLYITESGDSSWGDDLLDENGCLSPDEDITFEVPFDEIDIKITDLLGETIMSAFSVKLSDYENQLIIDVLGEDSYDIY